MANFEDVFGDDPICKHAKSYYEYEGDIDVVCGLCEAGYLFCYKCERYEPVEEANYLKKRPDFSNHTGGDYPN